MSSFRSKLLAAGALAVMLAAPGIARADLNQAEQQKINAVPGFALNRDELKMCELTALKHLDDGKEGPLLLHAEVSAVCDAQIKEMKQTLVGTTFSFDPDAYTSDIIHSWQTKAAASPSHAVTMAQFVVAVKNALPEYRKCVIRADMNNDDWISPPSEVVLKDVNSCHQEWVAVMSRLETELGLDAQASLNSERNMESLEITEAQKAQAATRAYVLAHREKFQVKAMPHPVPLDQKKVF